jgi:MarR family 2-MHQ and catechol resistance regulon transcriptional repressor
MKRRKDPSPETSIELCIQVGKGLYKWFDRRLKRLALTPAQLQVLAALANNDRLTMSALSEQLCCVGSNITALIGRMAEKGWVKREQHLQDRRVGLLRITPRGRHLLARATETPRCCREMAELLTPEEWAELRRLLEKLQSALQAPP